MTGEKKRWRRREEKTGGSREWKERNRKEGESQKRRRVTVFLLLQISLLHSSLPPDITSFLVTFLLFLDFPLFYIPLFILPSSPPILLPCFLSSIPFPPSSSSFLPLPPPFLCCHFETFGIDWALRVFLLPDSFNQPSHLLPLSPPSLPPSLRQSAAVVL